MDGTPNNLTGTIPTEFGNLPDLRILDLDENNLTGTIPEEIFANALKLQQLDLDTNQLTGTISANLSNLTQLNFFQLFSNPISGTFPSIQLTGLTELSKCYQIFSIFIYLCSHINVICSDCWALCNGFNWFCNSRSVQPKRFKFKLFMVRLWR